MLTFAKPSQTYLGGGIGIDGPALTPVLTFSPFATVWLCCICTPPALTPVLTFKARAAVWLWLATSFPALTLVLILMRYGSFLEKLIETDCGENRRSLVKLANSAGYYYLHEYLCGRVRLAR